MRKKIELNSREITVSRFMREIACAQLATSAVHPQRPNQGDHRRALAVRPFFLLLAPDEK
jgi:hypothetical protein